jgi:hypothetical protein
LGETEDGLIGEYAALTQSVDTSCVRGDRGWFNNKICCPNSVGRYLLRWGDRGWFNNKICCPNSVGRVPPALGETEDGLTIKYAALTQSVEYLLGKVVVE